MTTIFQVKLNSLSRQLLFAVKLVDKITGVPVHAKRNTFSTSAPTSEYISRNNIMPPRRALLYVPGHDKRKLAKVSSMKVDCVALDCEDGVADSKKEEARRTIADEYQKIKQKFCGELCVRINSPSSCFIKKDLEIISQMSCFPTTIIVPKINQVDEIKWVCDIINSITTSKTFCHIILMTESGIGLLNLKDIIEAGIAVCATKNPKCHLSGVIFGSDDFCADLQIQRSADAHELVYARQKIVASAKAFGLQAIDMVYIDFKDDVGLEKQSQVGAEFGFTGKQVIHPNQIPIVQKCFSPSPEQVEWANSLIEEFNKAQVGAFTYRGQMIDMPTVLQAKHIKKMNENITN